MWLIALVWQSFATTDEDGVASQTTLQNPGRAVHFVQSDAITVCDTAITAPSVSAVTYVTEGPFPPSYRCPYVPLAA
jgi:hypothetical protein